MRSRRFWARSRRPSSRWGLWEVWDSSLIWWGWPAIRQQPQTVTPAPRRRALAAAQNCLCCFPRPPTPSLSHPYVGALLVAASALLNLWTEDLVSRVVNFGVKTWAKPHTESARRRISAILASLLVGLNRTVGLVVAYPRPFRWTRADDVVPLIMVSPRPNNGSPLVHSCHHSPGRRMSPSI